ncbi:MAG: AsmA family protein [Woeseiaceae bacterium]
MAKLIKLLLALAGGVLVLVLIAVIAVAVLFDPNDYRDEISAKLSEATGRTVTLDGELTLGYFPWLSIQTDGITMSSAPGFGDEPMVRVGSASASVRILPLLGGNVEAGMVTVKDMALRLAVARSGKTSWQDLLETETQSDTAVEDSSASGDMNLSIAGVLIDNASVEYIDEQGGSRYLLSEFGLQVDAVDLAKPIPLKGGFKFLSESDEASGEVGFDLTMLLSEPNANGDRAISLRNVVFDGDVKTPALKSIQSVSLESSLLTYDTGANRMSLEDAKMAMLDVAMSMTLDGTIEPLSLSGPLNIDGFSPRDLMGVLDVETPETTDPDVLANAAMSGQLKLTDTSAELALDSLQIDSTTLSGELSIVDFAKAAVRFDLVGDNINLDGYLPPADESVADDAGDNLAETALPVDLIQGLDARGKFRMKQVVFGDLPFDNIELGLRVAGNKARLNPITATVLDGKYAGDVTIDATTAVPRLSLNETVSGLNLGTLAKLLWEKDNIEGTFEGAFKLSGRGVMLSEIRQSLDGDVRFALTDGALAGTDLWYQIRRARALFKQEPAPAAPSPARTEFSAMTGTAVVKNGVATNNDFIAELPFLRLTGAGQVDLGDSSVDYAMNARVLERPEFLTGASEAELDEYTEAVIPLKITGPMTAPSVKPDFAGLAQAAAQKKIDEEEARLRDRLKDKEDELKKRLKDLF